MSNPTILASTPSNAGLGEKAARSVRGLGGRIGTTCEARQIPGVEKFR